MTIHPTFLDDDTARGRLVEHLRCAHGILTQSGTDYGPEMTVRVSFVTAAALLDAAQRLCENAQIQRDFEAR